MAVSKGMVRKIRMAPGKENTKILILFNEELQIWDKNAVRTILVSHNKCVPLVLNNFLYDNSIRTCHEL